ncbi:hypothetical protein DL95DRAFT_402312 [Leptodontidium sp. 2 PMI_412]|nr:hypothetical protein DL95DRAFT_402312 [Leptodontidium sp. 2 PMI_412]
MEKYHALSQSPRGLTENSINESEMSKPEYNDLEDVEGYSYSAAPEPNRRLLQLQNIHIIVIYNAIVLLSLALLLSIRDRRHDQCIDPSLRIWSPAQEAVSYNTVKFDSYFTNRSPYTKTPPKALDKKWEDLYRSHLPHDENTYIITLGVFHQLHCVNHLRKALYPDEHPGLWEYNPDGTVKRDTVLALHWG